MGVQELSPRDLAARLQQRDDVHLIDVREPYEWRIGRIDGAELMPLGGIYTWAAKLDPNREIVLYCHHGQRSRAAAEFLCAQGFARVSNLTGGIDRWSTEVDPSVSRY
jgi:adenylyltransferase/sulfurtransferase